MDLNAAAQVIFEIVVEMTDRKNSISKRLSNLLDDATVNEARAVMNLSKRLIAEKYGEEYAEVVAKGMFARFDFGLSHDIGDDE